MLQCMGVFVALDDHDQAQKQRDDMEGYSNRLHDAGVYWAHADHPVDCKERVAICLKSVEAAEAFLLSLHDEFHEHGISRGCFWAFKKGREKLFKREEPI